jgi:hypothetical protein
MEGMNQLGINYMYTWKGHKETLCIDTDILNKQKCILLKYGRQEGKTGPVWRLVPVGREGYKKRV